MIVITAPTGTIGHQVLENVLGGDEPVRVVARDPSRIPDRIREIVEVIQGSHDNIDVVNQAFAGADTVFWLVPLDPHAESVEAAYVDFTRPACHAIKSRASGGSSQSRPSVVGRRWPERPGTSPRRSQWTT